MIDQQAATDETPLLPYYVYILLNPLENNVPFYVGKGTGQRVRMHFRDLERELDRDDYDAPVDPVALSAKRRIIFDIKAQGKAPLEVVVGRFETSEEAFAVEAALIHFVYGRAKLANIAGGHGGRHFRDRAEFEAIIRTATCNEDIIPKPGIDVPVAKHIRDNTFANAKLEALTAAGAFDLLDELQHALVEHGFETRDFTAKEDRRYDPGASNGNVGIIVQIEGVDFQVGFTSAKRMKLSVLGTRSTLQTASLAKLEKIEKVLDVHIGDTKVPFPDGAWKYRWVDRGKSYNRIEDVITRLLQYRDVMN